MSTVIGLDLSLTRTGIAIWRDGQMRTASTPPTSVNGKSYDARNRRIVSQVYSVLGWITANAGREFDLAVIEGPILHGPQTGSFFDRAQLWGFVFSQLRSREWQIPVAVVNNATLKAWATGKGNADKPMMLSAAREIWPRVSNHDEADAAWLACMGLVKLGDYPPVALTPWRLDGLTKPEWPVMA
jgi:Holliday junction resolvasome RuvABC endonuclease subunit